MYKHGYQLKTEVDFDNAIYCGLVVSITQDNEHIGSGILKFHNTEFVKLHFTNYYKSCCTFTVCTYANA
jgi:hypothetical protein